MGDVRHSASTRAGGFTLLELLLAITISAITASVLYAGLAIAFRARDVVVDELALAGAGRSVLEVVRADLEGAARPTGILAGPFIGEAETDGFGRASDELSYFTNSRTMLVEEPMGELQFVRLRLIDAPQLSDAREAATAMPERWLVREVQTNLLAQPAESPRVQVLARRVWSMSVRYQDGSMWHPAWNSTNHEDALPMAVELTLRMVPEGVDVTASLLELEEAAIEVRRTFTLLKGLPAAGVGGPSL